MFTKIFVFLLLGSALVLANPVQDSSTSELEIDIADVQLRGVVGTLQSWLKKADDAFTSIYDRVTGPFKTALDLLIQTGEGVMDYTKEKIDQLMYKYYEIKSKSQESLNAVKNTFIVKVIEELQKVIDTLSKNTDAETLEKLKQKTQELADKTKAALEKLEKQFQQQVEIEKQKLQEELEKWKEQADSTLKHRNSA